MNKASTNRISDLSSQLAKLRDRVTEREEEILKIKSSSSSEKQSSAESSLALSLLSTEHKAITDKMKEMKLKLEQSELEISILQQNKMNERATLTALSLKKDEEFEISKENFELDRNSMKIFLEESNEKNVLLRAEIEELNEIIEEFRITAEQSENTLSDQYASLAESETALKEMEVSCIALKKQIGKMTNDNQELALELEETTLQLEKIKSELVTSRTNEESVRAKLLLSEETLRENDSEAVVERERSADMINSLSSQVVTMR